MLTAALDLLYRGRGRTDPQRLHLATGISRTRLPALAHTARCARRAHLGGAAPARAARRRSARRRWTCCVIACATSRSSVRALVTASSASPDPSCAELRHRYVADLLAPSRKNAVRALGIGGAERIEESGRLHARRRCSPTHSCWTAPRIVTAPIAPPTRRRPAPPGTHRGPWTPRRLMTNARDARRLRRLSRPARIPLSNTTIGGPDCPGVAYRAGSMDILNPVMGGDNGFRRYWSDPRLDRHRCSAMPPRRALRDGTSLETFWGGVGGNAAFERRPRERAGLPVTTGVVPVAPRCANWAAAGSPSSRRISPSRTGRLAASLRRGGLRRRSRVRGLRCPTAMDIARVPDARPACDRRRARRPHVEAIVQVGTNLSFVALAHALETELGKPVVAINAATLLARAARARARRPHRRRLRVVARALTTRRLRRCDRLRCARGDYQSVRA